MSADNITDSNIDLIPELTRTDANVFIVGLLRNGAYFSEVVDPLFEARQ
jgi:hypothetical protein